MSIDLNRKINIHSSLIDGFKLTFIYQIFIGLLAFMMLDGGYSKSIWFIAMLAYFVESLIIIFRTKNEPTKTDQFFIKFGSLILIIFTPIIGMIVIQTLKL